MVFTGDGKGKTTSALGLALRSAGHGLKVCFIQFIKGSWTYGELAAVKRHRDTIDFHVMGRGFTWASADLEMDKEAARQAWEFARKIIAAGTHHLVVLDEFTYLLNYHMIDLEPVLKTLTGRPDNQHVAITGREAPGALLDIADLVTEMKAVKHPFQDGTKAQKGIEF